MKNKLHSLIEGIRYEVDRGYPELNESEKAEIFESIIYESLITGLTEALDLNKATDPKAREFLAKHTGANLHPVAAATKRIQRSGRIIDATGGDPEKIKARKEKLTGKVLTIVQKLTNRFGLDPKEVAKEIVANSGYDIGIE